MTVEEKTLEEWADVPYGGAERRFGIKLDKRRNYLIIGGRIWVRCRKEIFSRGMAGPGPIAEERVL